MHGDHDVKVGAQYQYSGAANQNQGNLNGTFAFGRSDAPFNAADPRTYPDRLTDPCRRAEPVLREGALLAGFAQDKWRFNQRLTLSLGVRYDLEIIPISETDDPLVDELSGRQEQLPAAGRRDLRPRRRQEPGARRLRPFLRQDALRADRRHLHRHAVHELVHGELPDGGGGCRPAQRPVPDRSHAGQRADAQPDAARIRCIPAASCSGTPARAGTIRIAGRPTPISSRPATSGSLPPTWR